MTALPRGETPGPSAEDRETDAAPGTVGAPTPGTGTPAEDGPSAPDASATPAEATGTAADEDATEDEAADDTAEDQPAGDKATGDEAPAAAAPSEAETELAAQRELRERIEKRKAEKDGPIPAGTKLSGTAADLLAAVRAVESGEKAGTTFFDSPAAAPAPRRAAPATAQPSARPRPAEPSPAAQGASPEAAASVRELLVEGGAPEALARPATGTLGEQAAEILREDPWQLLAVPGVHPEQADGFARALLGAACGPDDERRTAALVGWLLERAARQGHTALDATAVRASLAERAVTDPDAAVEHAVAEGVVLVFQEGLDPSESAEATGSAEESDGSDDTNGVDGVDGDDSPEEVREPVQVLLGLDRYALAEESLADGLARLVNACEKSADWTEAAASAPSPSAAELIRTVATGGLVAHSGGEAARAEPAALIAAARGLGLRALGTTHSTDGRRRLAEAVGDPESAVTLAGLLSGAEGPGRDEDGALALDLLVVLDAPQLDVEAAAILVEFLADGARLVLSGDPGVLGSAGAGRVFADVLAARACPQVVSRTPDPGPIGELVSGIGIGELNQVEAPGKEVVIVPVRDAGEAVHRTVQLVADSVPRAFGIPSADTQVITVGHGGSAGTRALNAALKQRLNPGPGRFGGFDPGDRVVHVPAPGRTVPGVVLSADAEGLRLDCAGTAVVVPQDRVETAVRHGWALSAHQAAGMRWPAVVVVLPGDAAQGLSRPWVYTAFSRGERHLSVVHGVDQALPHAVAQIPAQERTTRLRALLEALPTPDAAS
ncbi:MULTISPECIES: helix-hairpin-helix domain-containing protein [unclassified Streptomyces]|uniref:helix-hairpin-helix domain-containing protein n=1 Tax=unclassified Streptomyces TaxID=2593676 RepID=UPI00093D13B3|nr:helix-hairpin-helix domain-containing protein [Streptomyces sp. TSRI0281]OKI31696.1 DNA helicase RecD [Streptomyces sp. TSRI0281]